MKYDVIVVGAGPAGLMAARTAAEDGLKVVLVERKKDLYEVNRLCGQLTNINMKNVGGQVKYGYTERLNLEIGTDANRVHYPDLGFSIDYDGPIRPYLNYIHFSPGGQRVYREKDHCFAFFWDKRKLIAGLIEATLKAGVEIITEARADNVTDTGTGVKLSVTTRAGAVELEARKLIAADGKDSRIVEGLGLNRQRQLLGPRGERIVGYVMEGVADECRLNSWVCFTVPSLSPMANIWMFLAAGDRNVVGTMVMGDRSPVEITEGLMQLPAFSPWFRHAKLVKKLATASVTRTPIASPLAGNVLIIGDAAAMVETSNPGAIACGYQAARATLAEINQGDGYREYVRWVPMEHLDAVMYLFRQFFAIIVDYWRQAEPVEDAARRKQIADFRQAYNSHILDDDPAGQTSIATYGREQALRYFENVTFL